MQLNSNCLFEIKEEELKIILKLYRIWADIRHRCTNPSYKRYKDYGGRGIDICDDWKNSPEKFIKWAINNGYKYNPTYNNINTLSIDRIDNNKGYSPNNCKWATRYEQQHNQRIKKQNTSGFNGVSLHKSTNRWTARISVNGKSVYLGLFKNINDAVSARKEAEEKYWRII